MSQVGSPTGKSAAVMLFTAVAMLTWVFVTEAGSVETLSDAAAATVSVRIAGDDEVAPDEECAWQAIASGGSGNYDYSWWGALTGDEMNIFGSLPQSSWLWVEVTDRSSQAADTASIFINVDEAFECQW